MAPMKIKKGQKPYNYPKSWDEWVNVVLYGAKPYSEFDNKLKRIKERVSQTTIGRRR